jgi:hypothetical protein
MQDLAAFMEADVVTAADEHELVKVGWSPVGEPLPYVVRVTEPGRVVTPRIHASAVPPGEGFLLGVGSGPNGPAEVEDLALAVRDEAAEVAVAE